MNAIGIYPMKPKWLVGPIIVAGTIIIPTNELFKISANRTIVIMTKLFHPCSAATGILKGYDQLLNLVLDGTTEFLQGKIIIIISIIINNSVLLLTISLQRTLPITI